MNSKIFISIIVIFLISTANALNVEVTAPTESGTYVKAGTQYTINFEVQNGDNSDGISHLFDVSYGTTPDAGIVIIDDANIAETLGLYCDQNDFTLTTCHYDWNVPFLDENYFVKVSVEDTIRSHSDSSDNSFYIDSTLPVTTWDGNHNIWQSFDADIHLTCTDAGICAITRYRLDNDSSSEISYGEWQDYSTNILVSSDGNYAIDFYSIDIAGNTESINTFYVLVDKNPPTTSITGLNEDGWTNNDTVTITCTDAGSGCQTIHYKLDNAPEWTDENGNTADVLVDTDGNHSLEVYSTDYLNLEETPASYTIKKDSVAPTDVNDLNTTADQLTINLTWTASTDENGSGIEKYYIYRSEDTNNFSLIANSTINSYSDSGLTHGQTYTYYVIASDYADNNSSASNDANATALDTEGPTVTSNADSAWHTGTQTIELKSNDLDFATMHHKINGTEQSPTNANPKYVEISSEGETSLEFWATDDLNNEGTHTTVTVKIDNSPPNAPSLSSPGANSNGEVSLSWSEPSDNPSSANSGVKGYKIYRKTGAESYSAIATIDGKSNTSFTDTGRSQGTKYYYKVTAIDNLDHESELSNSNEQQVTMPSDTPDNTGDSVPPSVSWREPEDGDTIKDVNVTLKAYISDTSELKFISFTYKKVSESSYHSIKSFQTNLFNGTKTVTWDTSGLENGEYNLKVLARDAPGNVNSKVITVTLDRETTISVPDENADENKTELLLAEEAIENAKQSKIEAMDLINYWKKFNLDFSSDEKVKEGLSLLRKAEEELAEEKLTECIKDAEESKKLFDEFNQTEVNTYKTTTMNSENEMNLSQKLSNENEKLKKEVTTTREMQLIEVKHDGETYYQENLILKVKNTSDKVRKIQVVEVIPKELIESADQIKSNYEFTVIEEDPAIKWEMELAAGETREIIYSLDSKLNKEETDKIIESKISFSGNSVVLDRKTKIDKDSFVPVTGLFLLDDLFPIGIAVLVIAVLVGAFLFLKSKGFSFGNSEEKEEVSFGGLSDAYSRENFKTKRTLREEEIKQKKINPLGKEENGGRFSFKGD